MRLISRAVLCFWIERQGCKIGQVFVHVFRSVNKYLSNLTPLPFYPETQNSSRYQPHLKKAIGRRYYSISNEVTKQGYPYNITEPYTAETFRGLIFIGPKALMYDLSSYVAHIVWYIRGSQSLSSPCPHMCERIKQQFLSVSLSVFQFVQ